MSGIPIEQFTFQKDEHIFIDNCFIGHGITRRSYATETLDSIIPELQNAVDEFYCATRFYDELHIASLPEVVQEKRQLLDIFNEQLAWHKKRNTSSQEGLELLNSCAKQIMTILRILQKKIIPIEYPSLYNALAQLSITAAEKFKTKKDCSERIYFDSLKKRGDYEDLHTDEKLVAIATYLSLTNKCAAVLTGDFDVLKTYNVVLGLLKTSTDKRIPHKLALYPSRILMTDTRKREIIMETKVRYVEPISSRSSQLDELLRKTTREYNLIFPKEKVEKH